MLLPYGNNNGRLIHISEVPSGRTSLTCPYCEQVLLAKKGKQNAHHFAHVGKSCLSLGSAKLLDVGKQLPTELSLTAYTKLKRNRIQQALAQLEKQYTFLSKKDASNKILIKELLAYLKSYQLDANARDLVQFIRYEFANIPDFRDLSSSFQKHQTAVKTYHDTSYQLAEIATKLERYQQELEWFHRFKLYFLELRASDYVVFYKIGLTARPLNERIEEIRKDVAQFPALQIKVLQELRGFAFLETFFKQKYRINRYSFGQHTEYFRFEWHELKAIQQEFGQIIHLS